MIQCVFGERLLISDAISARNLRLIYEHEIAAVVDLAANELPATLGRDIVYCRFPLHDDESNSDELLLAAIDTVRSLMLGNFRTLVACSAGMRGGAVRATRCRRRHLDQVRHGAAPADQR